MRPEEDTAGSLPGPWRAVAALTGRRGMVRAMAPSGLHVQSEAGPGRRRELTGETCLPPRVENAGIRDVEDTCFVGCGGGRGERPRRAENKDLRASPCSSIAWDEGGGALSRPPQVAAVARPGRPGVDCARLEQRRGVGVGVGVETARGSPPARARARARCGQLGAGWGEDRRGAGKSRGLGKKRLKPERLGEGVFGSFCVLEGE